MLTWTWSEPHIAEKLFLSKQSVLWVWYLSSTWHKNCSHLLSTHPFSCHAYITVAVMLKDLAGPDIVKKNETSSSLHCASGLRLTTSPGHQRSSLWSVDTWDLLFLCPRMSLSNHCTSCLPDIICGQKCQTCCSLSPSVLAHHFLPMGVWPFWSDSIQMEKNGSVCLLQQANASYPKMCNVSAMKWCQFPSYFSLFALSVICMSLYVWKVYWLMPVSGLHIFSCSAFCFIS